MNLTSRLLGALPAFLFAVVLVSTSTAETPSTEHPNVLFIYLDDYGWRDASFMGSDFYETPNLDALAERGMVFSNAYSCAANCAPARASLLSGQYSPRHEIYNVGTERRGNPKHGTLQHIPGTNTLLSDIQTWAHQVRDAGYRTGIIGKWHLSDDPLPYGFDVNVAGTHSGSPPKGYFPPHPKVPGLQDASDEEYLTDRLTDEAIGFIEANQGRSWFLYLSHFAVHTPLQAKPELVAKYKAKQPGALHDHAVMAAMIESVDEGVGRMVDALRELGLEENTAIVFTSDNGGFGPATSMKPLRGYKGTYYEGGIREPFFVTWPGVVDAGTKSDVPVIAADLYPTFIEMTGAKLPADQPLDGVSLMPLLKQEGSLADRELYWHFPAYLQSYSVTDGQRDLLYRSRPCGIIRDGRWKLHEYFEDGGLELYDLVADPGESNNLADANPIKTRALHSKLVAWRERIGAPVPTEPNPNHDPASEAKAMQKAERKAAKR
ncbi:sulfatase [Rhodopirellula baltica]|uniref:Sulfatase n=1 Tax=Rhodopirellula baltica WH47 TaxID=991778 RepID=F2ASC4_RHOBT|nr:sulfatase [Rhodopirellula baltica]EGF27458.1 sulfatase [Rhodopirellula baltica WH47]